MSPFKDIMPSLERPIDMHSSPSMSADCYGNKKASFLTRGLGLISKYFIDFLSSSSLNNYKKIVIFSVSKPNFRIPRSSSMRTPSPPASWPRRGGSPTPGAKQTGTSTGSSGSFQVSSNIV